MSSPAQDRLVGKAQVDEDALASQGIEDLIAANQLGQAVDSRAQVAPAEQDVHAAPKHPTLGGVLGGQMHGQGLFPGPEVGKARVLKLFEEGQGLDQDPVILVAGPRWVDPPVDNGNGTWTLGGTPGPGDAGNRVVTLRVTDSGTPPLDEQLALPLLVHSSGVAVPTLGFWLTWALVALLALGLALFAIAVTTCRTSFARRPIVVMAL